MRRVFGIVARVALGAFLVGQCMSAIVACATHATKPPAPPPAPGYFTFPANATDADYICLPEAPRHGRRCLLIHDLRVLMDALESTDHHG